MTNEFTEDEYLQVFRQFMTAEEATRVAREFSAGGESSPQSPVEADATTLSFSVEPSDHYSRDLLILMARVSTAAAAKVEAVRSRLASEGNSEFVSDAWEQRRRQIDDWFSSSAVRPELRWTKS